MADDNRNKVTDYKDYFAKWGPKGFLTSPDKVVPFWDLTTSFAMKEGNTTDTSGTEQTQASKREAQPIKFKTRYLKAAGTDPKDQMHQWYDLIGEKWPFYIGGVQFGPPLLQLEDVSWSNFMFAGDGTIIAADAEISLIEWYEGIEIDQGWVTIEKEDDTWGMTSGDIFATSGASNVEIIYTFLRSNGFSAAAACGAIGNFMRESGCNPKAVEGGSGAGYGLAQWTGTRRTSLINWCKSNGYDYTSLKGQLNYFLYEWNQSYYSSNLGNSYKQITDVWTATDRFLTYFEGCTVRNDVVAFDYRLEQANKYYNMYKNYSVLPVFQTSTGLGASGSDTATTSQQQNVLSWCKKTAWPGANYCATWTTNVFQNALGQRWGGNGNDQVRNWCNLTNRSQLKAGMIIGVVSSPTGSAGRMYGHVAIYIGNNQILSSEVNGIITRTFENFCSIYGPSAGGSEVRWGWMGGVALA